MNPQPPVTKMRIAARTSSGHRGALADFPIVRDKIETWKTALAASGWTPWLIIGLATLLRFLFLGIKPPHFDEGINGWFVDQVIKNGFYHYDPTNYHGPLHFYVLLVSEKLFGRNLWALRLPVVLVSISCVWLTLKFEPLVGKTVSRLTALGMALSPGFIFYGRYSIHEVWLQLFSMLFILGVLGLWKFGTANYLWCIGMGAAGMILTKETYVIHLGCAIIAIPVLSIANAIAPIPGARPARREWDYVDLAMIIATGAALIVFFYSGTFFHWTGLKGLYQAYTAWFATGSEGHGHEKPWYYWLKTMAPSFQSGRADYFGYELPAMAGVLLSLFSLRFKNLSLRYLAIYGVGTLMVYSYVNYKTPWCVISFLWPFLFLFGASVLLVPFKFDNATNTVLGALWCTALAVGVWYSLRVSSEYAWAICYVVGLAILLLVLRYRQALYALIALLLTASLGSAVWLNYFQYTAENEPYVYVQTFNDINKLTKPLLALAKKDPLTYQRPGHIIRTSAYPLPWILGDFVNVGCYVHENLPAKLDAAVLLVQEDKIKQVEPKLHESYYTDIVRIRAYQDNSKLYLNAKQFKDFFPGREPDFKGNPQG
ncbi:MAG: glycosyltransferase family 39 protein [Chthoniobacterales bacterium]